MGVSLIETVHIFILETTIITSMSCLMGFWVFKIIFYQINIIYNRYMINLSFDIVNTNYFICITIINIIYIMSLLQYFFHYIECQKKSSGFD